MKGRFFGCICCRRLQHAETCIATRTAHAPTNNKHSTCALCGHCRHSEQRDDGRSCGKCVAPCHVAPGPPLESAPTEAVQGKLAVAKYTFAL